MPTGDSTQPQVRALARSFVIVSAVGSETPREAPVCSATLRAACQILVDEVPVQVHRHGRGGVSQGLLNHLLTSTCAEPDGRSGVPRVVHPESRNAGSRHGGSSSDRSLPVRLAQRSATRSPERPFAMSLVSCSGVDDWHDVGDEGNGPGPIVLQGVDEQFATGSARRTRVAVGLAEMSSPSERPRAEKAVRHVGRAV
jgi:hypothetical protein